MEFDSHLQPDLLFTMNSLLFFSTNPQLDFNQLVLRGPPNQALIFNNKLPSLSGQKEPRKIVGSANDNTPHNDGQGFMYELTGWGRQRSNI